MASKAEAVHAKEIRKGPNAKRVKKLAQRKRHEHHEPLRAGKAATYAKEDEMPGKRPSRKSTRTSSNRSKADANLNLRSERRVRAPKTRATRNAGSTSNGASNARSNGVPQKDDVAKPLGRRPRGPR
jgi:hypothetical protein